MGRLFICLSGVFHSSRNFYSFMETSRIFPVKDWIFWPIPGTKNLTGHPLIMVISEDVWHSHLLQCIWPRTVATWFNELCVSWRGVRTQIPSIRREHIINWETETWNTDWLSILSEEYHQHSIWRAEYLLFWLSVTSSK